MPCSWVGVPQEPVGGCVPRQPAGFALCGRCLTARPARPGPACGGWWLVLAVRPVALVISSCLRAAPGLWAPSGMSFVACCCQLGTNIKLALRSAPLVATGCSVLCCSCSHPSRRAQAPWFVQSGKLAEVRGKRVCAYACCNRGWCFAPTARGDDVWSGVVVAFVGSELQHPAQV